MTNEGHTSETGPKTVREIEAKIFFEDEEEAQAAIERVKNLEGVSESKKAELFDTRFFPPDGRDISLRVREKRQDGKVATWKWTKKDSPKEYGSGEWGPKDRGETEEGNGKSYEDALNKLRAYLEESGVIPKDFQFITETTVLKKRVTYVLPNEIKIDIDTFIEVERDEEYPRNIQRTLIEIDISNVEGVNGMTPKGQKQLIQDVVDQIGCSIDWSIANLGQEEALEEMGILFRKK